MRGRILASCCEWLEEEKCFAALLSPHILQADRNVRTPYLKRQFEFYAALAVEGETLTDFSFRSDSPPNLRSWFLSDQPKTARSPKNRNQCQYNFTSR